MQQHRSAGGTDERSHAGDEKGRLELLSLTISQFFPRHDHEVSIEDMFLKTEITSQVYFFEKQEERSTVALTIFKIVAFLLYCKTP